MMRKIQFYGFLTNFKSFGLVGEQLFTKEDETSIVLFGIKAVLVCLGNNKKKFYKLQCFKELRRWRSIENVGNVI